MSRKPFPACDPDLETLREFLTFSNPATNKEWEMLALSYRALDRLKIKLEKK